jgi:hypothetical protein
LSGSIAQLANLLQGSRQIRASKNADFEAIEAKPCKLKSELALEISDEYRKLPPASKLLDCERFEILLFLASKCCPANEQVLEEIDNIHTIDKGQPTTMRLKKLRRAATPKYEEVLDFILKQDIRGGVSFVVSLREDLIQVLRIMESNDKSHADLAALKELDHYLKQFLSLWFSPGLLDIRRITYEDSAASIIELIAKNEAVHPMQSLDDLRSRLGPGRRVFALFSPLLPEKPLVFCHVALTDDIPNCLSKVLTISKEAEPKVATFYSISNSQPGLAGLQLGEYLLKNAIAVSYVGCTARGVCLLYLSESHCNFSPVLQRLQSEFPSITTFVTLSPIPGFSKWVEAKINYNGIEGGSDPSTFHDGSFVSKADAHQLKKIGVILDDERGLESLSSVLKAMNPLELMTQTEESLTMKKILAKLACRYLLLEKHRRRPFCGVSRFHVGNGAEVYRVNFGADLSQKGIQQSYSLMVNYRYDMDHITENQARFEADFHIPASQEVLKWMIEDSEDIA